MSEAYWAPQGLGSTATAGDDQERLANLKRSIDSIEKRVAANTPQPPYASVPPATGPALANLQNQLNRLANHMPPVQPPLQSAGADRQAATAEITARQSMLNTSNAAAPTPVAQTTPALAQQADANTYKGMEAISRHLDDLKRALADLKQKVMQPEPIRVPQEEIDRIARAVGELQRGGQFNEEDFQRLTGEIEQLRGAVKQDVKHAVRSELAGTKEIEEQRLISVNKRLDRFSESLDAIGRHAASDMAPWVDNLAGQLDAMRSTIDSLPQKLAIDRLEERLAEVAEKLEYTMLAVAESIPSPDQAQAVGPENIETIERRLDEISRALVAVSNMGTKQSEIDLSAIERIEARMAELVRSMDTILTGPSKSAAGPELGDLSDRIETLTERLTSFEKQARSGDLGAASAMMGVSDISIIEDELRKLNNRFEKASVETQNGDLQQQIERLHARIEEAANVNSTAAQMSNLEAQIGQILRQLNRQEPGQIGLDLSPVEARLGQIESHILNTQNFSLEAAQQAAQHAVSMRGSQSDQGQIVAALSEDLRALQNIAEQGSAVSAQSILAVQETLAQVVDRLASIEDTIDEGIPAQKVEASAVHAANMEHQTTQTMQAVHRMEETAVEDGTYLQPSATDAGFTPATDTDLYGAAGSVTTPPLDPSAHLEAAMTSQMVAAEDNMPLEPGSAPDLDRLVYTASAKLNQRQKASPEVPPVRSVQASVVDAAPRAVKDVESELAASSDVDTKAEKSKGENLKARIESRKSGISFDFQKVRKPIVLAVAVVLLSVIGLKVYQTISGGNVELTQIEAAADNEARMSAEQPVATQAGETVVSADGSEETLSADDDKVAADTSTSVNGQG